MRDPLTLESRKDAKHKLGGQWWYMFRDWDFTIFAPPKCGSTAIKQFIYMHELDDRVLSLRQNKVVGDLYFVIRDPLSRFCSLWKNKCRDEAYIGDAWPIAGMSPTELMDYIESGVKNVHWTPQYKMMGSLTPILIPLELFGFWWKQSGLGELGVFNSTEGEVDIDDELKERILAHFAKDLELYHKAQSDFCWDTIRNHSKRI